MWIILLSVLLGIVGGLLLGARISLWMTSRWGVVKSRKRVYLITGDYGVTGVLRTIQYVYDIKSIPGRHYLDLASKGSSHLKQKAEVDALYGRKEGK